MRILYGIISFFFGIFFIAFLKSAGLDIPDWVAGLGLMIAFAGGCAGGD